MKITVRLKGGKGSGFHGHAGIPGHQGGSQSESNASELSNEQRGLWANAINIATYDKLQTIPHGRELQSVIENIPWGTKDTFLGYFSEHNELPPQAEKTTRPTVEGLLYAIRPYVKENPGTYLIDVPTLTRLTGWQEGALDWQVYGQGARQFFHWEKAGGLNQWRVHNSDYSLDKDNGIVTHAQALDKAMHKFGYSSPEKLYAAMLKYVPK